MGYALLLFFGPFVPGRPSWATRADAVWIEPSITPAAASSSLGFVWTYHVEWRSECATRDRLFRGSMTRATPRDWFSETTGRSQRPATRYGDTQALIAPTPVHTGLLADQVGPVFLRLPDQGRMDAPRARHNLYLKCISALSYSLERTRFQRFLSLSLTLSVCRRRVRVGVSGWLICQSGSRTQA
jgi:hypothetical protein